MLESKPSQPGSTVPPSMPAVPQFSWWCNYPPTYYVEDGKLLLAEIGDQGGEETEEEREENMTSFFWRRGEKQSESGGTKETRKEM